MQDPTAEPQDQSQDEIVAAIRDRRWEPESEWSHWVAAVVVVAGLLGFGWWALSPPDSGRSDGSAAPPAVMSTEPVPAPALLMPLPADVTSAAVPRSPGQVAIYECAQGGQKILSDRPCGADAVERVIDTRELNTFTETPMVSSSGSAPAASGTGASRAVTNTGSGPQTGADKQLLCERLQVRIDTINARTREKHSHKEGEYWRAEWHKAKGAYYDAGCGR